MTDVVPIANYRTHLEAEVAAKLLEAAGVPYVINSQEGMLHGPMGDGATILVRAADADLARQALGDEVAAAPPQVLCVGRFADPAEAERARAALVDEGVPALVAVEPGDGARHALFVPAVHGARARKLLDRRDGGAA